MPEYSCHNSASDVLPPIFYIGPVQVPVSVPAARAAPLTTVNTGSPSPQTIKDGAPLNKDAGKMVVPATIELFQFVTAVLTWANPMVPLPGVVTPAT